MFSSLQRVEQFSDFGQLLWRSLLHRKGLYNEVLCRAFECPVEQSLDQLPLGTIRNAMCL